ncbi:hypothetical protein ACFL44_03505 [Gemmatimonadota bacterium]
MMTTGISGVTSAGIYPDDLSIPRILYVKVAPANRGKEPVSAIITAGVWVILSPLYPIDPVQFHRKKPYA